MDSSSAVRAPALTKNVRRIFVVIVISMFVAILGLGIVAPLMPIYATELGAGPVGLALMVASFSLARGVFQPIAGFLSDRQGRKRFYVAGLAVYTVASFLYLLASSTFDLTAIRFVHGLGSAMVMPIAMAYIGDIAPEGKEGSYMSILNVALFSGIGIGPLFGGAFGDTLGIASAFYAMGALSGISLVLVLIFLPAASSDAAREETRPMVTVAREMSHNPRVMGILVARMASMLAMPPSFVFLPLLMTRFMDAGGFEIGLVLASRTLINAVLQGPMGKYADSHNKVALSTGGALAVVAVMVVVPSAGSMTQLIVLYMVMGLFEAVLWPAISALAVEEGRIYGMGSMMGVFNMAMSVGIFGGSIVSGLSVDAWGLGAAFYVGAVLFGIGTIAGWWLMTRSGTVMPAVADVGNGGEPEAATPPADGGREGR